MNTPNRLVDMLLRGKTEQFKTVMAEELSYRASVLMEKILKAESDILLNVSEVASAENSPVYTNKPSPNLPTFIPETTINLRDGNVVSLTDEQKHTISKLYEKLNTDNKNRMVKLLSESKESFNRVLNLAKIESKESNGK